jgi:hypothetical protein
MGQALRWCCALAAILGPLPLVVACAPVFSDLQSARLVGKGRVEVTPGFSAYYFSDDSGTEHIENHAGVQLATGVQDRIDLRLRYEHALDAGVNVLGFGPKLALVKDHLALSLPVGFAFGSDVDSGQTWQFHPTLIGTLPLGRNAEWNTSLKALVPLASDDGDTLVAINTGFGFSSNLDRWVLRPEVGMCFDPGEQGHYTQVSVGLTVFLGPPPARAGGR